MTRFSRSYGEKLATAQAAARRAKVDLESRPPVAAKRKPAAVTSLTGEPPGAVASGSDRKYGNVPTDGFRSKKEARRAAALMHLEACGAISDLRCQVKYLLIPKQEGERECTYTADFVYVQDGATVVEDVKGFPNDRWPIKRKLMLFVHGIRVKEV